MIKHRSLLAKGAQQPHLSATSATGSLPVLDIRTREALISALEEAVQIEHGLMVQYLYAALCCKRNLAEGMTPSQLTAVRKWQQIILLIARDEMAHLGTVCNLLSAVGGTPNFWRPAFPGSPKKWFPVVFSLQQLSYDTLQRFIRFEEPESTPEVRALGIAPPSIDYAYVGQLYRAIKRGFAAVDASGVQLFIGRPEVQDSGDWSGGLRIFPINSVSSAGAAIDWIVVQGEGPPSPRENSHYGYFQTISQEYQNLLQLHPEFEPSRTVVANPVTREHPAEEGFYFLLPEGKARDVAELFNHCYETMLMLLTVFFDPTDESAEQRSFYQATARRLMSGVIRPLAEILTTLPVDDDRKLYAGPPFEIYGSLHMPSNAGIRSSLMLERLQTERNEAQRLAEADGDLERCAFLAQSLDYLTSNWRSVGGR